MVSARSGVILVSATIGCVAFLPSLPGLSIFSLFLMLIVICIYIKRLRFLLSIFLAIFVGLLWASGYGYLGKHHQLSESLEGVGIWLDGEVVGLPKTSIRSQRFELQVLSAETMDGVRIDQSLQRVRINWYQSWSDDKPEGKTISNPQVRPGEHWRLLVRLKRPYGFANPGGFDYQGWLFQQGIGATGYVRQHQNNHRVHPATTSQLFDQWRYDLFMRLSLRLNNDLQQGLLLALLMGEGSHISVEQRRLLSATGTNHLFVISGLHVGFVALCAYWLFFNLSRWLLLGPPRIAAQQVGICGALAAACGYAALAGFSLPTQRALIMLVVMLLGRLFKRRVDVWHSYFMALLLVLLWDPLAPQSIGFWLSFGAVGSLLYAFSQRTDSTGIWWRWFRPQLVVFVAFFPVLLFFFQQVSLVSPLVNIVAIPVVGFIIVPLCLLVVLLDEIFQLLGFQFIELMTTQVTMLASVGLELIITLMNYSAQIPGAQWSRTLGLWVLLPAIAGTLLLMAPAGLPLRWLGLLCFLPLVMGGDNGLREGELKMTVLDVGQGLAVVIQTREHYLLYDVGARFSPTFDVSSSVIIPYLRQQGITALDRVIISHGDNDHAGSLPKLLAEVPVTEIISAASFPLLSDVKTSVCQAGTKWQWDNVDFELMRADKITWRNENNRSCVLKITGRNLSVLIPGDIEKRAELSLVEQLGSRLQADVLLSPHHGSLTSSEARFLAHVKPSIVIVSSGYRNRFGHPNNKVMERYRARKIRVLNTANQGSIMVSQTDAQTMPEIVSYRQTFKRYWF